MNSIAALVTALLLALAPMSHALAQTNAAEEPPAPEGEVAVVVNGHPILESEIEEVFQNILQEQVQGRRVSESMITQARKGLRPQILDVLIQQELLDEAAEEAGITVTDTECRAEMDAAMRAHLVRSGMSREEFGDQIQAAEGMTMDEFLSKRASDPNFRKSMIHTRLIEKKFPDEVAVTEEEVRRQYDRDRDRVFSQPETVRASHILISTEEAQSEEQKAAARKRAEELREAARSDGADFAALAKENSSCPSSAQGGDLGFFPREGAMVEPFAAAAFALKTGEVSDVVETQFGYHVIKVTGRKEAKVVPFEEAKIAIEEQIHDGKVAEVRQRYATELKEGAEITYPE
jgi:peptidyl-prolyl cis-trans isomerase C